MRSAPAFGGVNLPEEAPAVLRATQTGQVTVSLADSRPSSRQKSEVTLRSGDGRYYSTVVLRVTLDSKVRLRLYFALFVP